MPAASIDRELDTFRRELPELLADPANHGRFALVHGDRVLGLYGTFDAALSAGYEIVGLPPFVVKEVTSKARTPYFSRNLRCPS
jgi:hypothetical protein